MKLSEIKKYIKDRLKKDSPRNCDKLREQVAKMVAKMPDAAVPKHTVKKNLSGIGGDKTLLIILGDKHYILKIFKKPERTIAEIPNTLILSCIDKNMFSQVKMIGASFMILEYRKGIKTILSLIEEATKQGVDIRGPHFSKNMLEIIFQTYYALLYVSKFCRHFSHNDLHPKNIMVYRLKKPLVYRINQKKYICKRYGIMIIDYDWAVFTNKKYSMERKIKVVKYTFLKMYGISGFKYLKNLIKMINVKLDLFYLTYMLAEIAQMHEYTINSVKCDNVADCLKHPIFDILMK